MSALVKASGVAEDSRSMFYIARMIEFKAIAAASTNAGSKPLMQTGRFVFWWYPHVSFPTLEELRPTFTRSLGEWRCAAILTLQC